MTFDELQEMVWRTAEQSGWHEGELDVPAKLLMIHAEVSEAAEELRSHHPGTLYYRQGDDKPEGFPYELADVVIRCMDLAQSLGIDLQKRIIQKDEFNRTRPHRHGGKKL